MAGGFGVTQLKAFFLGPPFLHSFWIFHLLPGRSKSLFYRPLFLLVVLQNVFS